MSLKTSDGQASFPRSEEEDEDCRGADDGGRLGDQVEGLDNQP
jgi:hypothetical protein